MLSILKKKIKKNLISFNKDLFKKKQENNGTETNFSQLGLCMVKFCLPHNTFWLLFILFSPVWIQFGSWSTTLVKTTVLFYSLYTIIKAADKNKLNNSLSLELTIAIHPSVN